MTLFWEGLVIGAAVQALVTAALETWLRRKRR